MLNDDFVGKLLCHRCMRSFCMDEKSLILKMIEDILSEMRGENPYVTVSELFDE